MCVEESWSSQGLYLVRLLNNEPMPVTRDSRYVDTCVRVNRENIKVGKAKNFRVRRDNYWKDFDQENVVFEPLVVVADLVLAERVVKRALTVYRLRSPKGGLLEWLSGIEYLDARAIVFAALEANDVSFSRFGVAEAYKS